MFDIGFPELLMISIVALLVIGPEKLPETIRTASLWIGRIQRSFSNLKHEIENEIGSEEIRTQLHNESILQSLEEAKNSMHEASQEITSTIQATEENSADPDAKKT
mgnify:CR=1 FL=1